MSIPLTDTFGFTPNKPNIDKRYLANNGQPYTSVSAAETALASRLVASCVGLTVLVADENDPDYPKAKEYWVQPYDNNGVTAYHLVEKGAGTTDYADLDNKPTISDGGQGSVQIPLTGNIKVTATAATSGQTTGVSVTAENGEINMAFTIEKGADGENGTNGIDGKSAYQQWLDEGNTGNETDFLNSLKAQIGKFIYTGYNATAAALSIGGATTEALATGATNDSIVLMPNNDATAGTGNPTATMMFSVTVSDDPTPVTTYTYIGDVNVDASAFIGTNKITQDLETGGADKVPSAAAVKELKERLYGVEDTNKYIELRLENPSNVGFTNGVSASDNVCIVSSEAFAGKLCIVQGVKIEGYKKVKVDMTGKSRYGYVTFLKQSSLPSESTTYDGLVAGGYISSVHNSFDNMRFSCPNNQITELDIPSDAVAMFFTAKTTSEENMGSRLPNSIITEYGVNGGDLSRLSEETEVNRQLMFCLGDELSIGQALNGFIRNVSGRWAVSSTYKHAYIDVSGLQGSDIFVQNNEGDGAAATSIAFVTAQDTVSEVAIPSYLIGKYGIQRVANGVLGASELVHIPSGANYLYVYTGENNGARPKVFKAVPIRDSLGTNNDSGTKRIIPLYPLYNNLHIGTDSGEILEPSGSYKMWVQPVSEGDKLLLAVTFSSSDKILCYGLYPTDGLHPTFPQVGGTISGFQKLIGVSGQTYNVEINATTDGFLVFSCATANISKIDLYKEVELEESESERILVGNKELHFTSAIESAAINETYGDIHDLYDDLVTNYGNAFRKQSDILNDTENNNVICRYTLGYEMGGLFSGNTSYDFDNPSSNEFYTGNHEKKKVLLNAGIHGDEKTAVYGLYNFCKCLLESNDAWAEYIKSNYIIDVIPIVCTENYMRNKRTTLDGGDPNRNFGLRTIVPVNAIAGFIDKHHSEYDFHVDCHNHSDHPEAGAKCFVSALRDGLYFDEILQFASRFAGVCKLGWDGMTTWTKNGGTPVSDPKLVMQTNASTSVLGASYTMAFPAYTRAYGIHSLTMETPRNLNNTTSMLRQTCDKNAAKLTADMLIALLLYLA